MKHRIDYFVAQMVLTVVGLTGIVALFLPFAFGYSPADTAFDPGFCLLAIPFFLSILNTAASVRWVVAGSFSRLERAAAYIISAAGAGATLSFWVSGLLAQWNDPFSRPSEWLELCVAVSFSLAPLLGGIYALIRNSRAGRLKEFNPVMAIQVAYLYNAESCLMLFWGDWDVGAYCVLVTAASFLLQIILVSVLARSTLRLKELLRLRLPKRPGVYSSGTPEIQLPNELRLPGSERIRPLAGCGERKAGPR